MRYKLTVLLILCLQTVWCYANGENYSVWAPPIYSSSITKNKLEHFFSYASEKLGVDFDINTTPHKEEFFSNCENLHYQILLIPRVFGKDILKTCSYSLVLESRQPIYLFAKNDVPLGKIKIVGSIKGYDASEPLKQELLNLNPDFIIYEYSSFPQLIQRMEADKIDAFSVPLKMKTYPDHVLGEWKQLIKLKSEGVVYVLLNNELPQGMRDSIVTLFLENSDQAHHVFQDTFGLGPFMKHQDN